MTPRVREFLPAEAGIRENSVKLLSLLQKMR